MVIRIRAGCLKCPGRNGSLWRALALRYIPGRFLTPDWSTGPATVPHAHLGNPQTLNLYSYIDNNPINGIDPDGHAPYEYMIDPVGSLSPYMMSNGTGETGDSGEDAAAIAIWNAYATSYNQSQSHTDAKLVAAEIDAYNAEAMAQNSTTGRQPDGSYVADLNSKEIASLRDPNHKPSKSDVVGPNGECVDLTKKFSGMGKDDVGTYQWKKGSKVDKDTRLGTAIATFNDKGRYPSKHGWNSGIYLGPGIITAFGFWISGRVTHLRRGSCILTAT